MLVDKDVVLWYTILCEVLGSPCLSRPTTISNVWAAIPGLEEPGLGAGCPRALPLELVDLPESVLAATLRQQRGLAPPPAGARQLKQMVRKYYPVAAEGLVIDDVLPEPAPVDGMRAVLGWEDVNRSRRDVRTVVTNYLGSYWLLPAARPAGETLSPLLLWWCLLYAFSDLARYHPR